MDDLQVDGRLTIPAAELDETFETSGGPGGQHANRNETAVRLRWDIAQSSVAADIKAKLRERVGDHVEVIATESRSQFRNRAMARRRMQDKVSAALVDPPQRTKTKPTKSSRLRRLEKKRARGRTKRLRQPPDIEGGGRG